MDLIFIKEEEMWYYVLNNQQAGPTDENGLKSLLEVQTIQPTTLMWKEGMPDWVPLNKTELAYLLPASAGPSIAAPAPAPSAPTTAASAAMPAPSMYPAPAAPVYGQPYPQPGYPVYPQPVYQPYPQPVYGPAMVYPYGPGYGAISAARINELDQLMTWFWVCFGTGFLFGIPWIASFVLYYVILYKCWKVVQDGYARTTPGQAVGFLFLPFFNWYWMFVAYGGLAKDMNAYMARHQIYAERAPEGLAVTTCVFNLLNLIPYVDFITILPSFIMNLVLIGQLKRSACSILAQTRQ
jgi:hypothetical protein